MSDLTEAQLQSAVIDCARLLGWRVAHFRPARTIDGWRTPVAADGAGFPDLVLARRGVVIFAELKGEKGRLTPEQRGWLSTLRGCTGGCHWTFVWRPEDWTDGTIEDVLR